MIPDFIDVKNLLLTKQAIFIDIAEETEASIWLPSMANGCPDHWSTSGKTIWSRRGRMGDPKSKKQTVSARQCHWYLILMWILRPYF